MTAVSILLLARKQIRVKISIKMFTVIISLLNKQNITDWYHAALIQFIARSWTSYFLIWYKVVLLEKSPDVVCSDSVLLYIYWQQFLATQAVRLLQWSRVKCFYNYKQQSCIHFSSTVFCCAINITASQDVEVMTFRLVLECIRRAGQPAWAVPAASP